VPAYRHLLALCFREKSTLGPGPGRVNWDDRHEARRLLGLLVKQFPQVPEYRFDLGETLALMDVRGPAPNAPDAEKDFQESLRLFRDLVTEHPNVPGYQFARGQTHHKLGQSQRQSRQLDRAEKNLRQAVEIQNALVQRFPKNIPYRLSKVRFQNDLGDLLLDQKRWKEGRSVLESNISLLEKLIAQDEQLRHQTGILAINYSKLARALNALGEPQAASAAEQRANELGPPPPRDRKKKGPSKGP
jgi:tetratricopeptide (TPR) repeat protein